MSTAILIAGLAFGDETKGAAIDFYARKHQAHTVCRYSGASQCGHNVVLPDGRHHCFAQFGSGTFARAKTHLSRYMLVDPIAMQAEAQHLMDMGVPDPFGLVTIDRDALIITPYHVVANQLRELHRARHGGRHGSCGKGVGEARADAILLGERAPFIRDLEDLSMLRAKVRMTRDQKIAEMEALWGPEVASVREHPAWTFLVSEEGCDAAMRRYALFREQVRLVDHRHLATVLQAGTTLFEGAQGVLLDENHGFHPHTTYTTTTFANALSLLGEAGFAGDTLRVGLTRSYATRHGAGPFPSAWTQGTEAFHMGEHNVSNEWQEGFRVGRLDLVLLRYAIDVVGGIDVLGVSHLDRWATPGGDRPEDPPAVVVGYQVARGDEHLFSEVESMRHAKRITPLPVCITKRIPLAGHAPLDHQAEIGAALHRVRPLTTTLNPRTGSWMGTQRRPSASADLHFALTIADELGVRLGLVANGPTYEHRRSV